MTPAINSTLPLSENRSGAIFKLWLPIVFFGALWIDMVRQLSYQWGASEQYAYGWFVPFLALALFWKRWMTRPASQPATQPSWLWLLVAVLVVSLLPVRVVHEINPDWPLCNWLLALLVVGLSLYAVFLAGGWLWLKHFAFPVCFILIAVRWPYRIEHGLTQGLMRVVAGLTVEILGWFNLPAFQRGNLIELSTGVVGVDEACSGIRSFQSTLMAALFLGELYLLTWPRRIWLLTGGVLLSFCFNVVRTLILAWQASISIKALEKWHDPAGMMIFLISFACLWAIGALLRKKGERPSPASISQPSTLNSQPFLRRYLIGVGCWALCVVGLTEVWYRSHESKTSGTFHWSVALPESNPAFQKIEMAPRSLKLLAFDLGSTGRWHEENGSEWTLYFFRWNPRSVQSVIHSRLHRPDVCLPAAGLRQVSESKLKFFDAGELKLPFRRYVYESPGNTLYVFFCQWEDGAEKQSGMQASKGADRFQSVLTGRRLLGQQTLEIILTGCENIDQAEAQVRSRLPSLIRADTSVAQPQRLSALAP